MKFGRPLIVQICALFLLFVSNELSAQEDLAITVKGIEKGKGSVVVEIYKDKETWLEEPFQKLVLAADDSVRTFIFSVPYGNYGVSVYQDSNENGEADMNFIGIPKELVGFGRNHKPFGEPKFKSCVITHQANVRQESIILYDVL